MFSKTFIICLQAFLVFENVYCQFVNVGGAGYTGVEVDLEAYSRGAAGISGYGLGPRSGLSGLNIGNAGLISSGIGGAGYGYNGLGNGGLIASGYGSAGLEVDLEAYSRGAAGISGYGLGPISGLSGLNIGNVNAGAVASSIGSAGYGFNGISNAGLLAGGIGSAGLAYGGLGNAGLVASGLGNAGLAYGGINNAGLSLGGLGYGYGLGGVSDVAAVASVPVAGPFVSNGNAEIVVGGDFAASGTTLVAGQVPVLGFVSYGGSIPASGVVSIAGNCGCNAIPL